MKTVISNKFTKEDVLKVEKLIQGKRIEKIILDHQEIKKILKIVYLYYEEQSLRPHEFAIALRGKNIWLCELIKNLIVSKRLEISNSNSVTYILDGE